MPKNYIFNIHVQYILLFQFQNPNVISWIFEKFVLAMVVYFLVSIANSLAQSYHKRINKKSSDPNKKD